LNNDALLATDGSVSPQQSLTLLVSKLLDYMFIVNVQNNTTTDLLDDVLNLVDSVVRSISQGMVGGEDSLTIVSTGMRLSVGFYALDELKGAVIQPPVTTTDTQYERELPTITLPSTGFQICSELSGYEVDYVRLYMMEWIDNPYIRSNSTVVNQSLAAPIMRFASIGSGGEAYSSNASVVTAASDNTYTLTMHWNTEQNGTEGYETQLASYAADGTVSLSSPCQVSGYNSTSVTYKCFDLQNMCPATATHRRR
jgi:hypothetical protein